VPTGAVRGDDRHATPQPVQCACCGADVQVVKFSPQHTSVQWTSASAACCAEFRARAAEGTRSALVGGCAALRMSIDAAVAAGLVTVTPPTYDAASPVAVDDSARLLPGARGGGDPRDR
jgi:hypothetical protein